tara:strand:- start:2794 stop:3135 length:342 start_codon:yes stop_codon:yes gene_type:complete
MKIELQVYGLDSKESIKMVSDLHRLSYDQIASVAAYCIQRMRQLSNTRNWTLEEQQSVTGKTSPGWQIKAAFQQGVEDFKNGIDGGNPYAIEIWHKAYDEGYETAHQMKEASK